MKLFLVIILPISLAFLAKTHAEELRNRELLLAEERKDFMMRLETERTEYEKTVEVV